MWTQSTVHTIEQNMEPKDQPNGTKGLNPQIRPFAAEILAIDRKRIRKTNGISFGLGIVFMLALYLLAINKQIRLSGPFMPMFLMLFHQRLEYVLRYQALCLAPIAINALLVYIRKFMRSDELDDDLSERLTQPLDDSIQQFLMSTVIQMVLTANLDAQQVMTFCPFIAITFFIGRVIYLVTFPKYHFFGIALSFVPTLIAILFNAYGAIRFLFY